MPRSQESGNNGKKTGKILSQRKKRRVIEDGSHGTVEEWGVGWGEGLFFNPKRANMDFPLDICVDRYKFTLSHYSY